jgi:hypothetical protein
MSYSSGPVADRMQARLAGDVTRRDGTMSLTICSMAERRDGPHHVPLKPLFAYY